MNKLIETFGAEKRFVNWKYSVRKGKKTKVPYSVTGKMASSTDESTWSTYDEAKAASENIGIVFTPDQLLLGIDIDKCLTGNNITHEQKETIAQFIIEADTYCEISPSKTGLHLFFKLSAPLALASNKKSPYEIYTTGRYFTVTETPYQEEKEVRTISPDEALKLLSIIGYSWSDEKKPTQKDEELSQSPTEHLTDEQVLKKMFASKNGLKIKKLYDGDTSEFNDDLSSADLSLCSHLAFWTAKNPFQIERLWIASPLANRKKTRERFDYRVRTIKTAIDGCTDVYAIPAHNKNADDSELDLLFTLSRGEGKIYTQNTENICRVLRMHNDFKGTIRYDMFKNALEILSKSKWRNIEDNDAVDIQTRIQVLFPCFGKVGKDMVFDAMIKVAKENMMDSASDFITSLIWDGKERLDSWLTEVYGTPDDVYHRAVGANWLKGLVKRIIEPGCKFDYVLVLEGPQGSGKSTSLSTLGGSWHVETTMSTDSKDFFMQFSGKALIEFSEGETLSRTEVKRMKAIITMQNDKYRPPYERVSQEFPRRCVFAMTTNQTEYLKDETGNRRWLPISVALPEVNIKWISENRNQLFAEAYNRIFVKKETIYEFPKEETLAAQNARKIKDANTDVIADWYWNKLNDASRENGITIHQVYREAIHGGFVSKPLDKYNEMNIAEVLRSSLLLVKRQSMMNGIRLSRWFGDGVEPPNRDMTFKDFEKEAVDKF